MIKTHSPIKTSNSFSPREFLSQSPGSSARSCSPEEAFSSLCSPILDSQVPEHNALCNSPAEQNDKQASFDFSDLKFEDNLIKYTDFKIRLPKQKTSKTSIFRFGVIPLEAIEESSCEEVTKHKARTKTIHQSQHTSPRLIIDGALSSKRKAEKGKIQLKPSKPTQKSPYALHLSPSRLPALKHSDKTLRAVRSFGNLKLRKNLD